MRNLDVFERCARREISPEQAARILMLRRDPGLPEGAVPALVVVCGIIALLGAACGALAASVVG